ncbi:MAG: hypothetical protein JWN63_2286 [Candidatus Acidoferrum typicum]|nr:hypothetical protein [Candidatus Acidoferrum typicum]
MKKRTCIALAAVIVVLGAAVLFGYRKWGVPNGSAREEALALMPTDAIAILFADFDELRQAPFVAKLYAWAPKPQADGDYAQFLKETGFDFERDLERITIAVEKRGQDFILFAILDGKFDRQKISAYALKDGSAVKTGGREIFSVPVSGTVKKISLTFLRNDRIAVTGDANLVLFLDAKKRAEEAADWRARFERLAGSPIFAVIRQDAAIGAALAAQAPGGLRSPQLSTLLDQLQWITLAGKPENDRLRVVAEGECRAEAAARQLVDLMNGVVILAQLGLNDAKTRQQLDPAAREAYLELLKSADVSKINRGDSKSVRLVFEITPGFLEAARRAPPVMPDSRPSKPALPGRAPAHRKGRI